jgi:integrase
MEYVTPQLTGEAMTGPHTGPQRRDKMSAKSAAAAAKRVGVYSDGKGLNLRVRGPGAASWLFRYQRNGKAYVVGLGSFPDVSLQRARELAAALRSVKAEGRDPIAERAKQAAMTFAACAERYILEIKVPRITPKQVAEWRNSLKEYASSLMDMSVAAIGKDEVYAVLSPIWVVIPDAASKLRQRIALILDWASAHEYRSGENPAGKSILHLLPEQSPKKKPHKALPLDDLPKFMRKLRTINKLAARALEWTILTAARTDQTISAPWSELDLPRKLWTVPADRMLKGEREHVVPLSDAALASLPPRGEGQVFRIPIGAMLRLLRGMGYSKEQTSVHGFRSTFRDWAARSGYPREVAEIALSHSGSGNAVEQAYLRTNLLERRATMMTAWADACAGKIVDTSNVVALRA